MTKIRVLLTILSLVLMLAPAIAYAAIPLTYVEQGEYETMGKVVYSKQFEDEMLEIGGYLQHRVKVIVDPEVRQSIPRTPYTNTECLVYVSYATDETEWEIIAEDQAQARFKVVIEDLYIVEPPDRVNLDQGYETVDGTRYTLTPIETREGSIVKREWCLEPDKEYTLAIFKFTSTIPPGPDGQVSYTSSYQFSFTDRLPVAALARADAQELGRPPPTPIKTWPSSPWQAVGISLLAALILLAFHIFVALALRAIARRTDTAHHRALPWIPLANWYLVVRIAQKPWWWLLTTLGALLVFIPSMPILGEALGVSFPMWFIATVFILLMGSFYTFSSILWATIARRCNRPRWWGPAMTLLPYVGLIFLWLLAWGKDKRHHV